MKIHAAAILALAAAFGAAPAAAEPPAGHPGIGRVPGHLLQQDVPVAELPHRGRVLAAIHTEQYSYLEVAAAGETYWLAAPAMRVAAGDAVRFEDGAVMTDFYSRTLQKAFARIMFVGQVAVTAE